MDMDSSKIKHLVLTLPTNLNTMPPRHRNRGAGLCNCFGSAEPPEITYHVVENGGVVSLQPHLLTPTQPVPDEEELKVKFAELVDELDLTAAKQEIMFNLPLEKKWQLYLSKKLEPEDSSSHSPDYYIERVSAFAVHQLYAYNEEEVALRVKILDSLRTALRTQPNSYVMRFLEQDGLSSLLSFLDNMGADSAETSIHTSLIGCVKALMNNSNGRAHVFAHPTAINTIAQSLKTDNIKAKIAVLEILGAVCLVPGGHKKVLHAMIHFQNYACERTRFQTVINDLDRNTRNYRDLVALKTAAMSFINAIINYGPGQDHLEFRIHLRYELLMLGIQPIIDKLRLYENSTLDRHLDIFEMVRHEDDKELARKFEMVHVDTKSATSMFDVLKRKVSHTAACPHFLSLLHHCLLLPLDGSSCAQHWMLFDRIVQQLVLQGENKENPDVCPLDINVKEIVQLLATEEEVRTAREKAETLQKENNEISCLLAKKEQELEQHLQEKEDQQHSLEKMRLKLEKETVGHLEAIQKIAELEYRLKEATDILRMERQQRESLVKNGSLSDDAKFGIHSTPINKPPPPPPPPVAPPPPMPGVPLLLPLPTRTTSSSTTKILKKNIPQPSTPLKSFNWSKLPENKVHETLWADIDETKLYKDINLAEFDKMFSAYQKQQSTGSVEDITTRALRPTRELSVIDGRRAQNCTILLSTLRMTNEAICKAILSMDSKDQLPKDMVEQLLKFLPSNEEKTLLEEHGAEIENMARADRFLYEISRIVHYEQRIRTLFYRKKFHERITDCKPKIDAVMDACKEIQRSKRLKRLLEIVLAFGNYMNRGQRGNAYGFRVSSLNRIADTKSSINRNLTLLHYIIQTIETKFKDLLLLEEDIPSVRKAAKVNMTELTKEINCLKTGLHEVQKEVEFHRCHSHRRGDKFVPVMKEFITMATYKFSEIEENFQEMKIKYERVMKLFGEDPGHIQPDEFFGIFDVFLNSYHEAFHDNENMRRKKEEEERRAKHEKELRKRDKRDNFLKTDMAASNGSINGIRTISSTSTAKTEFDDLISALRTGDVFGDDLAKYRRNKKQKNTTPTHQTLALGETGQWRGLAREPSRERVFESPTHQVKG